MEEVRKNMQKDKTIIVDIDDTILDLSERRYQLFKRHFPKAQAVEKDIRRDAKLEFIGDRNLAPAKQFLADFSNPDIVSAIPLKPISGSIEALSGLIKQGINIDFVTSRHVSLRQDTIESLSKAGLQTGDYDLHMYEGEVSLDPRDEASELAYKIQQMEKITESHDVIATVGDRLSDMRAAISVKIPAILLTTTIKSGEWEELKLAYHVGLVRCDSWSEALINIGHFQSGSLQMADLRRSFTEQYSSWLQNLNGLSGMDLTVATILAAFSGQALLNSNLHIVSRSLAIIPLILSFLAIIFAIRAFTSRYTSGSNTNRAIVPILKQVLSILIDSDKEGAKYRKGDAIDEYIMLRKQNTSAQTRAHLDFFYKRYGTHNPNALLNLRLYEMRAVNYAKAYAEHLSSTLLIWGISFSVIWIIGVSLLDPSLK